MTVRLINPYADTGKGRQVWVRGNLHTHSTNSDGRRAPQELINAYAAAGDHFLAISDHDRITEPKSFDPKGMVLLRANEISGGCHVLHVGAKHRVEPSADRQKVIDDILADGGVPILCHPNWTNSYNHIAFEELLALKRYAGIEIFNSGCLFAPGSAYALEKWDRLLSAGRMVWGFANDDTHRTREEHKGWNVVRVQAGNITPQTILAALRRGRFYASTGVNIETIETKGAVLRLVAPDAQGIEVLGESGRRLAFVESSELRFDSRLVPAPASYFRVQCHGRAGRGAWTQPFIIRGGLGERMRKLFAAKPSQRVLRTARQTIPEIRDPLWRRAPATRTFYRGGDAGLPAAATAVRAVVTKTHLILQTRCDEPLLDKLRTAVTENSTQLLNDDCLEFFLDVRATGKDYFHLIANAAGRCWGAHMRGRAKPPACGCQALRENKAWTIQLAVSLASMGAGGRVAAGQRWGFHVCRNRQPVRELYFWSWTNGDNHVPHAWGWLEF